MIEELEITKKVVYSAYRQPTTLSDVIHKLNEVIGILNRHGKHIDQLFDALDLRSASLNASEGKEHKHCWEEGGAHLGGECCYCHESHPTQEDEKTNLCPYCEKPLDETLPQECCELCDGKPKPTVTTICNKTCPCHKKEEREENKAKSVFEKIVKRVLSNSDMKRLKEMIDEHIKELEK